MNASVVICAYTMDRWDALIAAINSCLEQNPAPNEIVLVIDHNDELLAQASLKATGVRVVPNRFAKGLSGARNTGVEESTGDVVVFLDDDAYADRGWLEALMRPLHDERVAGVGGWILPHWETAEPEWFPESFLWTIGCSYAGLPSSNSVIRNPIGASMAIRRRVFDRVGGFTSGLGRIGRIPLGGEETELCIRYNAIEPLEHFVLRRDAIVHHRVPSSRLTWHYFWTRCWAEGLSKAAVSSLSGTESGLSSERRHMLTALPLELAQCLYHALRNPKDASRRGGLIIAGTAIAVCGLFWGQIRLRRNPLQVAATRDL